MNFLIVKKRGNREKTWNLCQVDFIISSNILSILFVNIVHCYKTKRLEHFAITDNAKRYKFWCYF